MEINIAQIADLGFSYFAVIGVAIALAKLWGGVWPWFKQDYWPAREQRWQEQFEASQRREEQMLTQSASFLRAIETFQNGFTAANEMQHEEILDELRTIRNGLEGN